MLAETPDAPLYRLPEIIDTVSDRFQTGLEGVGRAPLQEADAARIAATREAAHRVADAIQPQSFTGVT